MREGGEEGRGGGEERGREPWPVVVNVESCEPGGGEKARYTCANHDVESSLARRLPGGVFA